MSRHSIAAVPMTPARRRPRLPRENHPPPAPPPPPRPPRTRPWAAAVAALSDLQDEYRVWLDNLPASLEGSRLAGELPAVAEPALDELQAIELPRGYGRD